MTQDALPPYRNAALLLDLDGTLVDIAPTPEAVVVPHGLIETLRTVRDQLDGALAVVSGRSIASIDGVLGDMRCAVAGEHGAAVRLAPGAVIERAELPVPPRSWLERGAMLEAAFPGSLFERKPHGFGVHFRLAPDAGPSIHGVLSELVADAPDFCLLPAHMLWEIRPRGVDKGDAVARLMRSAPFLGRTPVFIGDDATDEDGMRVARAMGGAGLRVQEVFRDAAGVRAWLSDTAVRADWGTPP